MGYVIKAMNAQGMVGWITVPGAWGDRTIGPRARADVFLDQDEAQKTISNLPPLITTGGTWFVLERAEPGATPPGEASG
jgi:hypothetical protein